MNGNERFCFSIFCQICPFEPAKPPLIDNIFCCLRPRARTVRGGTIFLQFCPKVCIVDMGEHHRLHLYFFPDPLALTALCLTSGPGEPVVCFLLVQLYPDSPASKLKQKTKTQGPIFAFSDLSLSRIPLCSSQNRRTIAFFSAFPHDPKKRTFTSILLCYTEFICVPPSFALYDFLLFTFSALVLISFPFLHALFPSFGSRAKVVRLFWINLTVCVIPRRVSSTQLRSLNSNRERNSFNISSLHGKDFTAVPFPSSWPNKNKTHGIRHTPGTQQAHRHTLASSGQHIKIPSCPACSSSSNHCQCRMQSPWEHGAHCPHLDGQDNPFFFFFFFFYFRTFFFFFFE